MNERQPIEEVIGWKWGNGHITVHGPSGRSGVRCMCWFTPDGRCMPRAEDEAGR